ncbi:MAG: SUMF1/EgtB/PvdO family nonheme iron enzyme [Myxococcales bacterium]|nr:SUMF1/EgtB/PvdO family nonheme iron enzyme [Myxococcales bacterium]
MDTSLLTSLDGWMAAPPSEQERVARKVARRLPSSFHYNGLVAHDYAGLQRVVARFTWGEHGFALLPGAHDLALGYAPERLTIDEAARAVLAHEGETPVQQRLRTFREQLFAETSPRRRVTLAPFLVAETAETHGASSTADAIGSLLSAEGFRLPTEDEWEYACGAGRDTFFKWGDHLPCEAWPPGNDPPPGEAEFADAARPNAFGLVIAHDPYAWEYCDQPGVLRGGDGGEAWCGGEGSLAIWRTLGTSYRCVQRPREIVNPFTKQRQVLGIECSAGVRRVLPLPPLTLA